MSVDRVPQRVAGYRPLFPYFGGKAPVAAVVWEALGDVVNYVEPFFGSGAVLFLRPGGAGRIETVNDADGMVANFWRAVQRDPETVALHADWPVNEVDVHARHLWLLGQRERITERLMGAPDFCDPKAAGWWVWGMACWIGSGWCSGTGPWMVEDDEMILGATGQGVHRKRPYLSAPGQGVHRQIPHPGDPGQGRLAWLTAEIGRYAARLRDVRVCCGDWSRVCGPSVTYRRGPTGVFLDPPYADTASRREGLYALDSTTVAHDVRAWAIEQGQNPLMRIVLAGYDGEHVMPDDWSVITWRAAGGYGPTGDDEAGRGRANRHRERLWLSPHCVGARQLELLPPEATP